MDTQFAGKINIEPPLNEKELTYFKKFATTRRMDRRKGPYFVAGSNIKNAAENNDVIDYNKPPKTQPGLWCKWMPTEDGKALKWNGYERFYAPREWLDYVIAHFLGQEPVARMIEPQEFYFLQGHTLNGTIKMQSAGKESYIVVTNNIVIQNDILPSGSVVGHTVNNISHEIEDKVIKDIMRAIKNRQQFCTQYEEQSLILYFGKEYISYPLIK